jgi:hypothetical protein
MGRELEAVQADVVHAEETLGREAGPRWADPRGELHSWCVREEDEGAEGGDDQPFVKRSRRATLNVGGVKHEIMWGMLLQVRATRRQHGSRQEAAGLKAGAACHQCCVESRWPPETIVAQTIRAVQVPNSRLGLLAMAETVGQVHIPIQLYTLQSSDEN